MKQFLKENSDALIWAMGISAGVEQIVGAASEPTFFGRAISSIIGFLFIAGAEILVKDDVTAGRR